MSAPIEIEINELLRKLAEDIFEQKLEEGARDLVKLRAKVLGYCMLKGIKRPYLEELLGGLEHYFHEVPIDLFWFIAPSLADPEGLRWIVLRNHLQKLIAEIRAMGIDVEP